MSLILYIIAMHFEVLKLTQFACSFHYKWQSSITPKNFLTAKLLFYIYICLYFICTFLTKAACCQNIEIVLHPTTLSYI